MINTLKLNKSIAENIITKTSSIARDPQLNKVNFCKMYLYTMGRAIEESIKTDISRKSSKLIEKTINFPKTISNTKTATFLVIDNEKIVSSSDKKQIGKKYNNLFKKFPGISNFFKMKDKLKNKQYFKFFKNSNEVLLIERIHETKYYIVGMINCRSVHLSPSLKASNNKLLGMYVIQEMKNMRDKLTTSLIYNILITIIVFIFCFIILMYMFTTIIRPITILRKKLSIIGKGNFDIKMEEKGSLETVDLIKAFNFMGHELKMYIENLKNETASRLSIESEIKIAANIQRSFLPLIDENMIHRKFTIYSMLDPAHDAAGDFYDYFFINKNKLAIIIADVVGKGISAAFFMALSKTILQYTCKDEQEPSKALNKLNKILSHKNKEFMFVTIFLIYYNIETGEISYSNGGHHEALLANSTGNIRRFGSANSLAVGVSESYEYTQGNEQLKIGDTLFLYTDGVTEAFSPNDNQFGEENLVRIIKENITLPPNLLCKKITKTVRRFERHSRFDDITVLALKRNC